MRRDRRWWWFVYGGCAVAVLVALSWISSITLGLERSERSASAEVTRQENLRLALWRMDSWLAMGFLALIVLDEAKKEAAKIARLRSDISQIQLARLDRCWERIPEVTVEVPPQAPRCRY